MNNLLLLLLLRPDQFGYAVSFPNHSPPALREHSSNPGLAGPRLASLRFSYTNPPTASTHARKPLTTIAQHMQQHMGPRHGFESAAAAELARRAVVLALGHVPPYALAAAVMFPSSVAALLIGWGWATDSPAFFFMAVAVAVMAAGFSVSGKAAVAAAIRRRPSSAVKPPTWPSPRAVALQASGYAGAVVARAAAASAIPATARLYSGGHVAWLAAILAAWIAFSVVVGKAYLVWRIAVCALVAEDDRGKGCCDRVFESARQGLKCLHRRFGVGLSLALYGLVLSCLVEWLFCYRRLRQFSSVCAAFEAVLVLFMHAGVSVLDEIMFALFYQSSSQSVTDVAESYDYDHRYDSGEEGTLEMRFKNGEAAVTKIQCSVNTDDPRRIVICVWQG